MVFFKECFIGNDKYRLYAAIASLTKGESGLYVWLKYSFL